VKQIILNEISYGSNIFIYGNGYGGKIYYEVIKFLRKDLNLFFIDDNNSSIKLETLKIDENFYILNSIITKDIREKVNKKIADFNFQDRLISIKGIDEFILNESVPFFHLISEEYYMKNLENIEYICKNLSYESSKLYKELLYYRLLNKENKKRLLNGYYFEPFSNNTDEKQYLEFIPNNSIETILEAGVYDGESSVKLLNYYKAKRLYGFKPFKEKFLKYNDDRMKIIKKGLWDKETVLYFNENGSSSKISSNGIEIETITIDEFCKYKKIDLIKMDIEGAEFNAIKGGMKTIKRDRPFLAISIYHSIDDFVLLTKYIIQNLENYQFEIGVYSEYLHEIILYALPIEKLKGK